MKVVIIEDEPLMADDLKDTLRLADPGIVVAAILPSVKQAMEYFPAHEAPDIIFSDIQLGDGLSFEIFGSLNIAAPVIFCTAYDEYALDAFKANGIDYVLKPFTVKAIGDTLKKYHFLQHSLSTSDNQHDKLLSLLGKELSRDNTTILVYQREKIIPLAVKDIAVCSVAGEVTRVHCFDQQTYIVSYTLDELENTCGKNFFRANRQHLINACAVREAAHYAGRKLLVSLNISFQGPIIVSKARGPLFLEWLTRR